MRYIKKDEIAHYQQDFVDGNLKTLKEWKKEHRIPVDGAHAQSYYPNGNCKWKSDYFHRKDTREMTSSEIALEAEKQREHRRDNYAQNKRKRALRSQKIREINDAEMARIFFESPEKVIILDLETTGLDCLYYGICEISIINGLGQVLYDSLVNPGDNGVSWSMEASEVNGIKKEDVLKPDIPNLEVWGKNGRKPIQDIMDRAEVMVVYSRGFDVKFLAASGFKIRTDVYDVMSAVADEVKVEWLYWKESWKWPKLTEAAEYYGYEWEGNPHRALTDTKATLHVLKSFLEDIEETYEEKKGA